MAENSIETGSVANKNKITLRGAIFIGIGSMVGAGIFALFGEAGTIAGAAVWLSFLIGGMIVLLATSIVLFGLAVGMNISGLASYQVYVYEAVVFPWWAPLLGTLIISPLKFVPITADVGQFNKEQA